MTFKVKLLPLGDSSVLIQLGEEIDLTINQDVHALAELINISSIQRMVEIVPAYSTLLVHYDPLVLSFAQMKNHLSALISQVQKTKPGKPRQVEVPIRYGGEFGPDLDFVASHCGLPVEDVVRIHSEKTYTVFMMGFTPGFPYMGKLDDGIVTPRMETPRTRVPAGTVAIAGSQTGIYPIDSPGGWRLIGRTSLRLFDRESESPFLLSPGDQVRFVIEK